MNESTALAPRLTVPEAVRIYENAVAEIRTSFAAIARAEKILNDTLSGKDFRSLTVRDDWHRVNFDDPDRALDRLKRDAWKLLVDRLELRRMMSVRRAAELDKQLDNDELPEITVENVEAFARGMMSELPTFIEEAVGEVFNWLRPPSSRYKTNSELEVPPKVIVSYAVERKWMSDGFRVNHHREQNVRALENVFTALDGKGQIGKTHKSRLGDAIEMSEDGRGETEYFRFRAFKNGNLHLWFLREDLLRRFNEIAGGKRLRPGEAA